MPVGNGLLYGRQEVLHHPDLMPDIAGRECDLLAGRMETHLSSCRAIQDDLVRLAAIDGNQPHLTSIANQEGVPIGSPSQEAPKRSRFQHAHQLARLASADRLDYQSCGSAPPIEEYVCHEATVRR